MSINQITNVLLAVGFIVLVVFHIVTTRLAQKEAVKRDKYDNIVNRLQIIDHFATAVVPSIAVNPNITKSDSKQAAVSQMNEALSRLNIPFTYDELSAAAERAYQTYKAEGKDIHIAQSPLSEQQVSSALGDVQAIASEAAPIITKAFPTSQPKGSEK